MGRALGLGLPDTPLLGHALVCGALLGALDRGPVRNELVAGLASNQHTCGFAHFERSVDPSPCEKWLRTTVTSTSGSGHVLNGEKVCVLNGATADGLLVTAIGPQGHCVVHVPADAPGVRRLGQKLVDGRESCRIGFENVAIPATQMLAMNSSADSAIARACRIALAALAGEALGALERALENTKEYLLTRQQFGKPLAQQQVLRHRFADMYMVLQEIESLGLLAAKASASGRPDADLLLRRAKIHVGMAGVKAAESAVQLHGAMGVTEELAVGHCLRRVLTVDSLFGNARQHLELAAPHIAEW